MRRCYDGCFARRAASSLHLGMFAPGFIFYPSPSSFPAISVVHAVVFINRSLARICAVAGGSSLPDVCLFQRGVRVEYFDCAETVISVML